MSWFSKVSEFLGGNFFKEVKDTVMAYLPPNMTPQEKIEVEIRLKEFLHKKEIESNRVLTEAAVQLDKRIAEQEGTASDLRAVPFFGTFVLFLRGMQRPVWGFATLYMDFKWFFETNTFTEQQQTAMIVINVLVLGFLFGERTIKNLEPLIVKVFGKGLDK